MNKYFKFPNGLRMVYENVPSVRSVSIGVYVGAGCVYEDAKNNGVSHFIEHMNFKGTKTRTAFDIVAEIDNLGAKINAATSKQFTYYYTLSLDEDAEKCLEILSDIYFNSVFPNDEFERERKVILEELAESEDTPDDVCFERTSSYSFGSHPFARTILGTKESLTAMTRQDLIDYKARFYTADNTVLSIVGNVDFESAKALVEKYFASQFVNEKMDVVKVPYGEFFGGEVKVSKKIEQVHITMAFETVDYSDDRGSYILSLLSDSFAGGMSSRLFQTIREKMGLCYSIYGYPSFMKHTKGRFFICMSTNTGSVDKAINAIKDEIRKLTSDGLTEAELAKSKRQSVANLVIAQEMTIAIMRAMGRRAIMDDEVYDIDKEVKTYESITIDEINDYAKKVFNLDRMVLGLVGDFDKEKKKEKKNG
ncbi:MAG: insulinase family protein [Acidaminococcus sp.]|nr:insulinase family protein [Acidaminococcus sp.]MDY4559245.1 pitrilysin family protein [Eubacteriales bacterium]